MEHQTNTTLILNTSQVMFSWYDYILFGVMLGLSCLIGVYFGFIKKQSTANDYLLGGKEMSVFPIAMSLIASSISGVTLLGVPADIYRYGVTYWLCCPVMVLVVILCYYIYIPVFYKLQITSIFEYLKFRFDTKIRSLSSHLYTISVILYLPVVIYIPALALSQATGVNIHLITPIVCGVCIFYTTIGGLKAVVWTDTLQLIIMIGTIAVVFVMGILSVGGFGVIWEKSKQSGRLSLDFDLDVTKRDTIWSGTFALTFMWMSFTSTNQSCIQKCLALPKYKDVRNALIIFVIGMITFFSVSVYTGLIMFAKYFDCDPYTAGKIEQPDQILPYYVMDVAGSLPGLPGLFIAGIFSAALSTLSAVMNCLAGTIYEDFVSQFMPKNVSEKKISNVLKLLVLVIGIVCTSLVFVVEKLGGLLQLAFSLGGVTHGPLLGLFSAGMLIPMVNAKGALCGGVTSLLIMSWIVAGNQWAQFQGYIKYPTLPLPTDGCDPVFNMTMAATNQTTETTNNEDGFILFRISYYYYIFMGDLIVIVVSVIVSAFTRKNDAVVDRNCISPIVHFLLPREDPPTYYSVEKALHILNTGCDKEKSRFS